MRTSKPLSILSLIFLAILLIACAGRSPRIAPTPLDDAAAPTLLAETMSPLPTLTFESTGTPVIPTVTHVVTRTPFPSMVLDGLRAVYAMEAGNLYVQDSGESEILLTQGIKGGPDTHPPLISDDGMKIIFFRAAESGMDSVYAINADGTGEQQLFNTDLLSTFGADYDKLTILHSMTFVPGTHLLLFNTYPLIHATPDLALWLPVVGNDLFIVDTDTGKLKQLRKPWQGGNFLAAPNGKWVAVQTLDHIDVIDLQGQMVRRNLVTYERTEAHVVVPMYWTPDSSELIVLPTDIPEFVTGVIVDRTIWRYPVSGAPAVQIKVSPPPIRDAYAISPDGNWIAYSYDPDVYVGPEQPRGVYLADLHDGTSQLIYVPQEGEAANPLNLPRHFYGWNADSTHYLVDDYHGQLYVGDKDGNLDFIGGTWGIGIYGWIDTTHYFLQVGGIAEIDQPGIFKATQSLPDAFVFIGQ